MNGQWIGNYQGSNEGTLILNIDELATSYRGIAYLHEGDLQLPGTAATFTTANKEKQFEVQAQVLPISPITGMVDTWENIKNHCPPGMIFPSFADVTVKWNEDTLELSWTTDIGTFGRSSLPKSQAHAPSTLTAKKMDWATFKKHISDLDKQSFVFRGQIKPWRLRTSFHRNGRSDLMRFIHEDIQILLKHLTARTNHFFNLKNPDENGAFFNLVQHHGYPTPLLDWTYSPYVAAFFAYRGITNTFAIGDGINDYVRVHVFNHIEWKSDFAQIKDLLDPKLHFSISEFLAIDNERMIPQQALSSITNIDDIETYIQIRETVKGKTYLEAIDLPVKERRLVCEELQYMGITAGSLFPGLDGSCEELKDKLFKI